MLKEFRDFAVKGSVLDMAIGIVIGGAFSPIVKSLVDDLLMPVIGLFMGGADFAENFLVLKEGATAGPYATLAAAQEAGAVTMNWGVFVNTIITFIIVAFAIFMMVKTFNRWKQEEEEAAPAEPPKDLVLLEEIRDALKARG
jgi:large conductance mechanosensitive channel